MYLMSKIRQGVLFRLLFFFNDTATTEIYTLSLHDALPIPLLDRVTWRLGPGDRVGIVGVNGSGKTSLLRVLDGEATGGPGLHAEGTIVRGKTVRLAHLSQELAELDPDQRVREAVEEIRLRIQVGDRELSAGQLLERLGFTAERQWTRVGDLSGCS